MSRETVNHICRSLPGAECSDPWNRPDVESLTNHDVWKVGGKIFASIGTRGDGVALKCASVEDALHLEDLFGWPKAPYFHRSWVHVPLDTPQDEVRHRICASYRIIRATLTKKAQADLAPFD